jgi:platelet-activating factor acetylhydrolase
MIFSHGLGGSRNTYSHLLASLASHGVVVVAAEHRDGSAPQSRIKDPANGLRCIEYKRMPHARSPEVEKGRNDQLRIRLWELGLIHDAVSRLDKGNAPRNWVPSSEKSPVNSPNFKSSLDMHEPGRITWAGHSFGAATMVQFVKSVFWDPSSEKYSSESLSKFEPLFKFSPQTTLASQISPISPIVLLDLWTLPLRGDSTLWLWERSLPCYAKPDSKMTNVLAILSEEFFQWQRNFKPTTRVLCANPAEEVPASTGHQNGPRIFYPLRSAHLSQSDFAVLFPWITKKWMGADEPERTLRLNVRAILQMLRENGVPVEDTRKIDAEEEKESEAADINLAQDEGAGAHDWNIMAKDGGIRGWIWVSMSELGGTDMKEKL